MDDDEFFDLLYQGWSKTTGAETTYWMPELIHRFPDGEETWGIWAVDQNEEKHPVVTCEGIGEADAAWITALHGCFADLVRRLHEAVDDAERYDCEKDRVISEMAVYAEENNDLRERLKMYEGES